MSLRINDIAPDFSAETTQGLMNFHEWLGGSWAVLFSHPKDFTPVCTTELGRMAHLAPEFAKRGVKVVGLSVDPVDKHALWADDIAETQGAMPDFPMIGDPTLAVAKLYDMLPATAGDSAEGRTAADNATDPPAERPDEGQIVLGGRNVTKLRASSIPFLRRNIGVVFQEVLLLNRSIAENLRIGKPDATDEEIREARKTAYQACIDDFTAQGVDRPPTRPARTRPTSQTSARRSATTRSSTTAPRTAPSSARSSRTWFTTRSSSAPTAARCASTGTTSARCRRRRWSSTAARTG